MSFYNMPLTNTSVSYKFTNGAGLIVMCYGTGAQISYYYLAGSAMRDLDAAFYANDIHHSDLSNQVICNKTGQVDFRAEIEGLHPDAGSLKWFVDGAEETAARDQQTWSKIFATGTYDIEMQVRYENDSEETITATLKVEVFWIKMKNVRY
jgi:hypothetical protein